MAARKPRKPKVEEVATEEVAIIKEKPGKQKMTIEYREDGAKVMRIGGMKIVSY